MLFTRKHGFTIIELLVVVVIIGILTTVATANFLTAQRKARDNARKAQISATASAVETYYSSKRKFPGKLHPAIDGTPDTSLVTSTLRNCEQHDANGFYYYYFPLSVSDTGSTLNVATTPCDKRGDHTTVSAGLTYTYAASDYKPYPSWIPGLGEYLNPIPLDTKYLGNDGSSTGAYGEVLAAKDGSNNSTRTYVYRRLKNGYMIYSRLESEAGDPDSLDGSSSAITLNDQPQPYSGSLSVSGRNIYILRK